MTGDLLRTIAEDPTIRVPQPELREVREAVFEFTYASSALSNAVFVDDESVETSVTSSAGLNSNTDNDETEDTDSYPYGTTRSDVMEVLTRGASLGSVAIIYRNGDVDFFPPIRDEKRARRIREGLSAAANKALQSVAK